MPLIKSTTPPDEPNEFGSESVSEVITEFVPMKTAKHQHSPYKEPIVEKSSTIEEESVMKTSEMYGAGISEMLGEPEFDGHEMKKQRVSSPVIATQPDNEEPSPRRKSSKNSKGVLFLLLLILLLGSLAFGFYALFHRAKTAEKSALASPTPGVQIQQQNVQILPAATPVPSATPSTKTKPTPSPSASPTSTSTTVTKKSMKIRIENGTTTAGEAAQWKTFLTDLGYTVVSVGNAAQQTATATTIQAKATVESFIPQLITDLKPKATATEATTPLATSATYDVLITIGK